MPMITRNWFIFGQMTIDQGKKKRGKKMDS